VIGGAIAAIGVGILLVGTRSESAPPRATPSVIGTANMVEPIAPAYSPFALPIGTIEVPGFAGDHATTQTGTAAAGSIDGMVTGRSVVWAVHWHAATLPNDVALAAAVQATAPSLTFEGPLVGYTSKRFIARNAGGVIVQDYRRCGDLVVSIAAHTQKEQAMHMADSFRCNR